MYQAIPLGRGRRVHAESIKQLVDKLARDNIRVGENELNRQKKLIDDGHQVIVAATRRLSRVEIIKKSMHPPYLGNPYRHIKDTENVCIRVSFIGKTM